MKHIKIELRNVTKEFPARRDDVSVKAVDNISMEIYDGEFFAMLGPSGCGKTTTLRMIAGFEQPSSGEILLDGQMMQGIPAFQRPVNTVFQDYALFPHMNVLQNVMFGLQMDNVGRKEARERAEKALELVRLPQAANRKPSELSGGMQQRVALARALVKEPSVLLLDEPLGALDLKLRREMQFELKAMQQQLGITFIYVTHDQEEALTMANRIAVMDGGHVLQVGKPEEIYESPATRFVADFIGETNFLPGILVNQNGQQGTVQFEGDTFIEAVIAHEAIPDGSEVTVAVRPEKLILQPYDATFVPAANMNMLQGHVQQKHYIGTDTRYSVHVGKGVELIVRLQNTQLNRTTEFRPRDLVQVLWENQNARILAE